MDPYYLLNESISLSDKLLSLLDKDEDRIRTCLQGELLDECRKASDKAEERIKSIKQRLLQLQMEQREMLFS